MTNRTLIIRDRTLIEFCYLSEMTIQECKETLDRLYGDQGPCERTIRNMFNKLEEGTFNYEPGLPFRPQFQDHIIEAIRPLIAEDATLSLRKMEILTGISSKTIKRYLLKYFHFIKRHAKWVPHTLTPVNMANRVEGARDLLAKLEVHSLTNFNNIVTGDETWITWRNPSRFRWQDRDDPPPVIERANIGTKKSMVTVFFGVHTTFVSVSPRGEAINANSFIHDVLTPLSETIQARAALPPGHKVAIHYDNAPAHSARAVRDFLPQTIFSKLPHPAWSPDLAPCDFWLFGNLKTELRGLIAESDEDILEAVFAFMQAQDAEMRRKVFRKMMKQCREVIRKEGRY
ncbi:putative Mariner Mos1 transposase [Blattamonas nauphoetae]|uniref:Mariner Mos1 transposase n=1 Tax=Blattamonas nauphoetae TaxID=2049346 RepID=A0ABQ9XYE3_9EUKA|nr:putative Mariner Mos1 transposase [Blattamonas nauphoetae]